MKKYSSEDLSTIVEVLGLIATLIVETAIFLDYLKLKAIY